VTPVQRRDPRHEGQVLPFRRGPAARRRRRSPWLALLAPLGGALAVVGLPLSVAGWVLASPRFALRSVVVEGNQRVAASWVERTLQPLRGRHLLRLPLAEAQRRLAGHPWIDAVELRRELPDRLRVRLHERRPAAIARQGEALLFVDAAARPIAPFDPAAGPDDLLLLSAAAPGEGLLPGLALAEALGRSAPEWSAGLSEIEVLGEGDFRIYTAALPFPLLVRGESLAVQSRRLHELLPEIRRRYPSVEAVDLRFPQRIIVQPAAPPGDGRDAGGDPPTPAGSPAPQSAPGPVQPARVAA
jgi:cell division septal protein FtsQ